MDNFEVNVVGCEPRELELAIKLVMNETSIVDQWAIDDEWLCFYWHPNAASISLPVKLRHDTIVMMIAEWLLQNKPAGNEPDIDGSTSYGFEIKASRGNTYELFRVRPIWALHGK